MPMRWLKCYLEMLSILQAEEAINRVEQTAVGTGNVSAKEHKRALNAWLKTIRGGVEGEKNTSAQALANAASFGIGVKRGV